MSVEEETTATVPQTRAGAVGHGQEYEKNVTAYLFFRGGFDPDVEDFRLLSNIKDVGDFDDIVYSLKKKNGFRGTYFMQLKYKSNPQRSVSSNTLLKSNNFISLPKQQKSYKDVMKFCESYPEIVEDLSNIFFVIHTNGYQNNDMKNVRKIHWNEEDIWTRTQTGEVFSFHEDSQIYKELCLLEDGKEFLEKLLMFVSQGSHNHFEDITKILIKNNLGDVDTDKLYSNSSKQLFKLLQKKKEVKKVDFVKIVYNLVLKSMKDKFSQGTENQDVKCSSECLQDFQDWIKNGSQLKYMSCSGDYDLLKLKVCELLTLNEGWLCAGDSFVEKYAQSLGLYLDDIAQTVLIIHYTSKKEYSSVWPDILHHLATKTKVLIISEEKEEDMIKDLVEICPDVEIVEHKSKLTDLNIDSQEKILEKKILFQEFKEKISLKEIIKDKDEIKEWVSGTMLMKLIKAKNPSIKLGEKLDEDAFNYVERNVYIKYYVLEKPFRISEDTAITVTGLKLLGEELKNIIHGSLENYTFQSSPTIQFKDSKLGDVKVKNFKNVYLIDKIPDEELTKDLLRKHNRMMSFEERYIGEEAGYKMVLVKTEKVNVHHLTPVIKRIEKISSICEISDRHIIVAAEPGMGKTTLLTHWALTNKEREPENLVLKINFNDHTDLFENCDFNSLQDAVSLITQRFSKSGGVFEENFIKYSLQSGKCLILLDGFDEISPKYEEKAVKLMGLLLNETKIKKLCVTSRLNMKYLQSRSVYRIEEFTREDQIQFLKGYWKGTVEEAKDETILADFITSILKVITASMPNDDMKLLGIPLQTRMLAEAFEEKLREYLKSKILNLPERLNWLELYESFIENKIRLMCNEKFDIKKSHAHMSTVVKTFKKEVKEDTMLAALLLIIPDRSELSPQLSAKKIKQLLQKIDEGKDRYGIISHVVNGIPNFIHRTFAEFFTALWFKRNFKSNQEYIKVYFFNPEFEMVRYMFDLMLAKHNTIHTYIITKHRALQDEITITSEADKGGRQPLHLATFYAHAGTVKKILSADIKSIETKDDVLGWCPVMYADMSQSWTVIGLLLKHRVSAQLLKTSIQSLQEPQVAYAALECSLEIDSVVLFQFVTTTTKAYLLNVQEEYVFVKPSKGSRVSLHSQYLKTVHMAAMFGAKKILINLLETTNASIDDKIKAVTFSIFHREDACTEILLRSGVDVNSIPFNMYSLIHLAVQRGHVSTTKLLIKNGAKIDIESKRNRMTPLMLAIHEKQHETAKMLVELGADVNKKNASNESPLLLTTYDKNSSSSLELAELLIQKGANVNDRFPINEAILHKDFNMIDLLMRNGADLRLENSAGELPINMAAIQGNTEVLKYLSAKLPHTMFVNLHPIFISSIEGDCSFFETFENVTECVNITDERGASPIHYATRFKHINFVELLLKHGANPNIIDNQGVSVLLRSIEAGADELAQILVRHNTDIHVTKRNGSTVLHLAVEKCKLETIKVLVEAGASLTAADAQNFTPTIKAQLCRKSDVVKYLKEVQKSVKNTTK